MTVEHSVEIWGDGALAAAALRAAQSLGWDAERGPATPPSRRDVVCVAPLASTVVECDAMIARASGGRAAFAWPMVSVTAVQQMIGRCRSIGTLTHLSSRATRPTSQRTDDLVTRFLPAAHDQIALVLLIGQISGSGSPTSASISSSSDGVDRLKMQIGDIAATVEVTWDDSAPPSLDVQAAGVHGVLRIETDPATRLEHNGEPVPLPTPAPIAHELEPLRDAGMIDMLKTIGASLFDGRPLAHAFSLEFGRSIVALLEEATLSDA